MACQAPTARPARKGPAHTPGLPTARQAWEELGITEYRFRILVDRLGIRPVARGGKGTPARYSAESIERLARAARGDSIESPVQAAARKFEEARCEGDRTVWAEAEFDLVVALMEIAQAEQEVIVGDVGYRYGQGDEPDLYRRPLSRSAFQ